MCGIAGELRLVLGERARADRVRAMCDVMVHRGPDDEGLRAHAEVALGMRRLSIVDVSGGQQPLANEDGSVQVVCNGEIYNSALLRSALEARGHRFRSRSDVEVIAHLYEEEGVDAIGRLEGMFALALWDARRHRLLLARDRFGIKPLYLAETPRAILFGSEAKCLLAAVESHLMSDVPLGVFLSGGLDSGSIVAFMHELGVHPIRTFTIGFEESSYSEVDLARQVATRFGTEHHELIVRPDAAALLPKLVHHFGEPFADSTAIPTWYVSQLARRHVKVVLCGEGGDEILAGYETYRARRFAALYGRLPRPIGGWLVPGIVRRLPVSHARASFDYKAKKFVAGAYLPPAAGHLWWMTMMAEDMKAALYANGRRGGDGDGRALDPTLRPYEALYRESDGDDLDRLQYIDTTLYLPGDLLAKSDRMSMAHSLEARVPFLDRAVVELARRIPPRLRLRHLRTKYMLRRAMAGRLPEPILRQRKLGFNVPLAGWLAGALRDFAQDVLAPSRLRRQGLLDAEAVGRLLSEPVRHEKDPSPAIWALLFLVVWHDELVSGSRPAASAAPISMEIDR